MGLRCLVGREAIVSFLTRKWNRELDYRLIKEIWASTKTVLQCVLPMHDDSFNWFRSYGNENWEFNVDGLMHRRAAWFRLDRSGDATSDAPQRG